jgi:hypothetical protein
LPEGGADQPAALPREAGDPPAVPAQDAPGERRLGVGGHQAEVGDVAAEAGQRGGGGDEFLTEIVLVVSWP